MMIMMMMMMMKMKMMMMMMMRGVAALSLQSLRVPPLPARTMIVRNTRHDITIKSSSLCATREATFGMGCFWEPSEALLKKPGILATAVGYTGVPSSSTSSSTRPARLPPTYDTVCFGNEYVEAVRVVYDDSLVTYETVLDYFYQCQKPGYSRQYSSIIFANDQEEGNIAEQWRLNRKKKRGSGLRSSQLDINQRSKQISVSDDDNDDDKNFGYENVAIECATPFYRAEEYHQKYWEKQRLRGLLGLLLIAGESGAYNTYAERMFGMNTNNVFFGLSLDSLFGGLFFLGAGWMLLERLVARDVRELKPGDLARELL